MTDKAPSIAHKALVRRVAAWLRRSRACKVVLAERTVTAVSEQPDAIGWTSDGFSTLVEVKISRSDFLADRKKFFRQHEDLGVGQHRYFAAPKGLIEESELPDGWGLLEAAPQGNALSLRERVSPDQKAANFKAEVAMLVSAIRRLEISATVFVEPAGDDEAEP